VDERRGSNDEGEPEDVRELRTMADTVREALLDASLIAHGDELLRYVGLAEIAACLTRLEPSAQRTVWNMQPRMQYDPHDPGPTLTEASQRRGVETILITRPATLLATIFRTCSADNGASHQKFIAKYKLPFPLLSDPDRKTMKTYGAYGEKMMYGKKTVGVIRSTVWIGPDGKVKKHWARVADAAKHPDQVLALLQDAD